MCHKCPLKKMDVQSKYMNYTSKFLEFGYLRVFMRALPQRLRKSHQRQDAQRMENGAAFAIA